MAIIRRADAEQLARDLAPLHLGDLRAEGEVLRTRARSEAEQIVEEARAERQRLISDAAEHGSKEGHGEGYRRGLEEGREAGRLEAIRIAGAQLARLEEAWLAALAEFERDRERMLADAKRDLVGLALGAAGAVTKRAIEIDDRSALRQLEAIFEQRLASSTLSVVVSPGDESVVREHLPALATRFTELAHATVLADPTLADGSCILRTASGGEVDAGIGAQLRRIAEAVLPGSGPAAVRGAGLEVEDLAKEPEDAHGEDAPAPLLDEGDSDGAHGTSSRAKGRDDADAGGLAA